MKILLHTGVRLNLNGPATVSDIFSKDSSLPPYTIAAYKENKLVSLNKLIRQNCALIPLTMKSMAGRRIYQKSLTMIMLCACSRIFPGRRIRILHSIAKGLYCITEQSAPLSPKEIQTLKSAMEQLIAEDVPFETFKMPRLDAITAFSAHADKLALLEQIKSPRIPVCRLENIMDIRLYPLVPSTGYLGVFDLIPYEEGMLLRFPRTSIPDGLPELKAEQKLFSIFKEDAAWSRIMEVTNAAELNRCVSEEKASDLIKIAEALHEKKIAAIADQITNKKQQLKFIFIAGPSSSGKTTFAKRLAVQLRVNGIKTIQISMDNYFLPRELTPKDSSGEYNFETIDALDLELFNQHLQSLLAGKDVDMPRYSFQKGRPHGKPVRISIPENTMVIIEGIHCLNEKLSSTIPAEHKYRIYVSALTQLNLDDYNRIPTTDNRLLRRIVRDALYRGYSAAETIQRWPSVRLGEGKYIFPFQEDADIMFNSALIYELAVIKDFAYPLLKRVPRKMPQYDEARRLLSFLDFFLKIKADEIPPTSILREFIGRSTFHY